MNYNFGNSSEVGNNQEQSNQSNVVQNKTKFTNKAALAPSKATVYISNFPFSLTNNDICKIFSKFGEIVKVTIVKNKENGKSKGVAFILFCDQESALSCVKNTNGYQMFGRTLKSNIAKDNGRAAEFIKRKEYPDKTSCYECGESGHLSYSCPKNVLGERPPPPKKKKLRPKKDLKSVRVEENIDEDFEEEEYEEESLSAAIQYQQELREGEKFLESQMVSKRDAPSGGSSSERKKVKKSSYFSDEEEVSD